LGKVTLLALKVHFLMRGLNRTAKDIQNQVACPSIREPRTKFQK
jgi:hypothetical protein